MIKLSITSNFLTLFSVSDGRAPVSHLSVSEASISYQINNPACCGVSPKPKSQYKQSIKFLTRRLLNKLLRIGGAFTAVCKN